MTNGGDIAPPTRNPVRDEARERAKELRELHRKKDRRRRWIIQGSVAGGTLAILVIVAFVLLALNRPAGRGPLNMQSDGIKIGEGFVAERTGGLASGRDPIPSAENPADVIDIRVYVDYLCANCGSFEENNSGSIRAWVESGAATVEIHPIAVLTTKSAGTQYSLRAANAAACVAEFSPDSFLDFHDALFVDQPAEGSVGLDDEELVARASAAGVTGIAAVRDCVAEGRFRAWVRAATERAISGPIPGADIEAVVSTPTILVNGEQFAYSADFDPNEFRQFVLQAAGEVFNQNPTPTPTPTPSATPAG